LSSRTATSCPKQVYYYRLLNFVQENPVKQMDQKIQDVIQQKEDLRQKADLLTQEKGVGPACLSFLSALDC